MGFNLSVPVDVLLVAQANLTRTVIFNVLFPGITIGQLLMFIGAYGMQLAQRAERGKSSQSRDRFVSIRN
jgi:hypothetical protein